MSQDPVVIVAAKRTPLGGFQGVLSPVSATDLSAAATRAALDGCGLDPGVIDEVILGCVLPAGLGQAPARQAALAAGLSNTEVALYDLRGHLVRRWQPGGEPTEISWDGATDGGQRVAAGVYIFRMRARGRTLTRKATWLP